MFYNQLIPAHILWMKSQHYHLLIIALLSVIPT